MKKYQENSRPSSLKQLLILALLMVATCTFQQEAFAQKTNLSTERQVDRTKQLTRQKVTTTKFNQRAARAVDINQQKSQKATDFGGESAATSRQRNKQLHKNTQTIAKELPANSGRSAVGNMKQQPVQNRSTRATDLSKKVPQQAKRKVIQRPDLARNKGLQQQPQVKRPVASTTKVTKTKVFKESINSKVGRINTTNPPPAKRITTDRLKGMRDKAVSSSKSSTKRTSKTSSNPRINAKQGDDTPTNDRLGKLRGQTQNGSNKTPSNGKVKGRLTPR